MSRPDGELSVREPGRKIGGKVMDRVWSTPADWVYGAHHVVLLVHGYNNNRDEARESFQEFLDHLPTGPWRIGGFQWPGDSDFGPLQWLDFLSYPAEIPDARKSAERLADFLAEQARANPTQEITLVGHSLGCRLVLEMLDRLKGPSPAIRHILLMAAAVPVTLASPGERLNNAGSRARERFVLFSPADLVLRFAFPLGQTLARILNTEDHVYLSAVGLNGDPNGFASETPLQACGNGHSDYWKDADAAAYLAQKLGVAVPNHLKERCLPKHDTAPAHSIGFRELPAIQLGLQG